MYEKRKKAGSVVRRLWAALVLCLAAAAAFFPLTGAAKTEAANEELRGVWISYLDWEALPSEEEAFQKAVDAMLDRCVQLKMNAVFVHVRPDADAMYPSDYFPWSRFVTGAQGHSPGYDPLDYFVHAAHARKLQFHAWINPFRVTGYHNVWSQVADSSVVKQWTQDEDPSNDRWVLKQNGAWYLNPSIPQVRELIVNGVREVMERYPVDGIHFDDYFYPEVDDEDPSRWFDKPEYEASGSLKSIGDWRRENVNALIRQVYQTVKDVRPSAQFGISPEGYVEHLRSNTRLFTDIDTWMSQEGYLDYMMPQIYWGFEQRLPNRSLAPYAFSNNLKTWIELKKKGKVRLYLGLAMYKAGSNNKDYNETSEWLRRDDIIRRQVEEGRASGQVSGYCFYSYSSFQEEAAQGEVEQLMEAFSEAS